MDYPALIHSTLMITLSRVVHNNLSNELFGVEELAQAMGMSRGHLYRRVRALTGSSPNMMLNIIRLHYGKELLDSDNFTIAEVAYKVGFNSNTYFIKCFSDHFGVSPGRYKQQRAAQHTAVETMAHETPPFVQAFRTIISSFENQNLQKETPDNLPTPATRFFGREKEIDAILEILSSRKLVSVIGVGGTGKTRVAIEAGRKVKHLFPDGVWFINLAPITQEKLVINAFGEAINIKDQDADVMLKTITTKISNRKMLLIVDNCEHLADECARILTHLLSFTLKPKFLITSREVLKVSGETTFVIPPLPVPQTRPEDQTLPEENESVLLFVDRARLVNPGFSLTDANGDSIVQLCQKLDGIPLAIELAASRIRIMSPMQIAERLHDEFKILSSDVRPALPRHKTLEATIDWSINLLSEKEKTLFFRLPVFNSDFDLEDVESICHFSPLRSDEISDLIVQLADKSLLTTIEKKPGIIRYKLLEILKQYAANKVGENDFIELKKRYVEYYMAIAREGFSYRIKGNPPLMTKLELGHDNIIGALENVRGDFDRFANLSSYMAWYWYEHSRVFVATEYLNSSLRVYQKRDAVLSRLLFGLALMQAWYTESDSRAGLENAAKAVSIPDQHDPDLLNMYPQYGMIQIINTEYEAAEKILKAGMQSRVALENPSLLMRFKIFHAWNFINQNRPDAAEPILNDIHNNAHHLGNDWDTTVFKHIYADIPLLKDEYELAELRYIESLKAAWQAGNSLQAAIELLGVAMAVSGQGRHKKALRLNGAFFEKFEELNAKMPRLKFWDDCYVKTIVNSIEAVGKDEHQLLNIEGRAMGFEAARQYAVKVKQD